MKKIMLALSFLSVGGMISAANWAAEEEAQEATLRELGLTAEQAKQAATQRFLQAQPLAPWQEEPVARRAQAAEQEAAEQEAAEQEAAEQEAAAQEAAAQQALALWQEAAAPRAQAARESRFPVPDSGRPQTRAAAAEQRQELSPFWAALIEEAQWQEEPHVYRPLIFPVPACPTRAQRQKRSSATRFTVAALIAAATTYVTRRAYQNRKKLLVKEYDLGNLNKFEDKLWLATIIARYGISWRLRALISNNPAAVAKLSDPFLNALAELYYGKKPSQVQMSQFMQRFFPGRK